MHIDDVDDDSLDTLLQDLQRGHVVDYADRVDRCVCLRARLGDRYTLA